MRGLLFIILLHFTFAASAADTSHEAAAREYFAAMMETDKPRLAKAFVATMGNAGAETADLSLEMLESPEYETLFVSILVKIFSEKELLSLVEMTNLPAYQLLQERLPALTEKVGPEMADFFRKNQTVFSLRVAAKREQRRALCEKHGPHQMPGKIKDNYWDVFPKVISQGYSCTIAMENKKGKFKYVGCSNQQTYCDQKARIGLWFDSTTLEITRIDYGGIPILTDDLLTKLGYTPSSLPQR